MTHTETPWNIWFKGADKTPCIANNNSTARPVKDICTVDGDNREEDATFIVTACNSHDALYNACEKALALLENLGLEKAESELVEQLRVALAKAEPES
jgi:hypothetical protein